MRNGGKLQRGLSRMFLKALTCNWSLTSQAIAMVCFSCFAKPKNVISFHSTIMTSHTVVFMLSKPKCIREIFEVVYFFPETWEWMKNRVGTLAYEMFFRVRGCSIAKKQSTSFALKNMYVALLETSATHAPVNLLLWYFQRTSTGLQLRDRYLFLIFLGKEWYTITILAILWTLWMFVVFSGSSDEDILIIRVRTKREKIPKNLIYWRSRCLDEVANLKVSLKIFMFFLWKSQSYMWRRSWDIWSDQRS